MRARCAPKQILLAWLQQFFGIKNIDYLIADPNLIFKNEEYNFIKKKIIFMPKIWNVLVKPINLPEINLKQNKR